MKHSDILKSLLNLSKRQLVESFSPVLENVMFTVDCFGLYLEIDLGEEYSNTYKFDTPESMTSISSIPINAYPIAASHILITQTILALTIQQAIYLTDNFVRKDSL